MYPPQGLGKLQKSTFFFGRQNSTHWLFSNPPNPLRTLSVHDVIHIPWSHFLSGLFILKSLNDTSSLHACEHLRSCLHLTNPCAKQKVLSLTKLKGKIYKTKSLGHYITLGVMALKGYSTFSKAPALLEPHHQIV